MPVSENDDFIALSAEPIDVPAALVEVGNSAAGAINLFLGITRSEVSEAGQRLLALDYEAYADMAIRQMHNLALEARRRWKISGIVLIHRTGRVAVGEPSVLIAVSTPHRAESFESCRFLIDSIKAEATIWKKEVWEDGKSTWVHPEKT
jgi:molybdopterin synthase catalytic subunit